jgi:hypothetical protein
VDRWFDPKRLVTLQALNQRHVADEHACWKGPDNKSPRPGRFRGSKTEQNRGQGVERRGRRTAAEDRLLRFQKRDDLIERECESVREGEGEIVSSWQDADLFSCWREDTDHILDGDSQAQGKPDRQSMA